MTPHEAKGHLRLWHRWSEPEAGWVRHVLLKHNLCKAGDSVSFTLERLSGTETKHLTTEELAHFSFLKQLVRIAKARVFILRSIARCGDGKIEKCVARVVLDPISAFSEDDFFVRLDVENRDARAALLKEKIRQQDAIAKSLARKSNHPVDVVRGLQKQDVDAVPDTVARSEVDR